MTKFRYVKETLMLLLFLSQFSISSLGADFKTGGIYFKRLDKSNVEVSRGTYRMSGDVIIPSRVKYNKRFFTVKGIGDNAFVLCNQLKSVSIPSTVTYIGTTAFGGCTSLKSIVIPRSVTQIGEGALEGCLNLRSVLVEGSFTNIPDEMFSSDTCLVSVAFQPGLIIIGDRAFENCTHLKDIKIPGTLMRIGTKAFSLCIRLERIDIPNSVTSINAEAFGECHNLTQVTLGNAVTYLGNGTFENCRKLTSINLPQSLASIGDGAFSGCSALDSICLPETINNIGEIAFFGTSLRNITIPASVKKIGERAFFTCPKLESIEVNPRNAFFTSKDGCLYTKDLTRLICVPNTKRDIFRLSDSVADIDAYAFYGCNSLTSIEASIHNSHYASTGGILFSKNLKSLIHVPGALAGSYKIPSGVAEIASLAFSGCKNLTDISIPASVNNIGKRAFSECSTLENINVDALCRVYSSENGILYDKNKSTLICVPCAKKGILEVPASVSQIGDEACQECTHLEYVIIPRSVESIGTLAFDGCTGMTSVTIPNTIKNIGTLAFRRCFSIRTIHCYIENPTMVKLGADVFSDIPTYDCLMHVPAGSIATYFKTTQWNTFSKITEK
jgi:hypothetical protein